MAGNLVIDSINGVDISVSPPATQAFANSLLAEYVVIGAPVTSIDFSGLDINTHKSYRVEIELYNPTVSETLVYCFINNDTGITNYYSQLGEFIASASSVGRSNTPTIGEVKAGIKGKITANVSICIDIANVQYDFNRSLNADIIKGSGSMNKIATVANITQLTFVSSVAGAIGVGSKIRIYRGNV